MSDLPNFLTGLKRYPSLNVVSLMSHFAAAEEPERMLTQKQVTNFEKAIETVKLYGFNPKWIHLQASAGLLNIPKLPCTVARTGLAFYGLDPNGVDSEHLKPAMQVTSQLIQIRDLPKGESVGYGGTFTAPKDMTIGVIPFGYFEGLDRRLSNVGTVLIDDIECRIIGRISMNITTVDISKVKNPHIGQKVIVFSDQPDDANSFQKAADLCQTIPYELLVHIVPTLRRAYQ